MYEDWMEDVVNEKKECSYCGTMNEADKSECQECGICLNNGDY